MYLMLCMTTARSFKLRTTSNVWFIIEKRTGVRFTCLKDDAPRSSKIHDHWKHAKPSDSPDAHPFHDKFV